MVPRMGLEANYFRVGNSSTWSTSTISGVYAASALNIYGFNTLDTLSTPTISDVCTAGTACTRGSLILIILPVAVFGPSVLVLLILPVRAVLRTPLKRALQHTQHQQYPEYRTPQCCRQRWRRKKSIEHHTYEDTVPSSSIMHRHTYLQ